MKVLKGIAKVIMYLIGALLAILFVLAIWLWIKSPGKAEPITDSTGQAIEGSISSIEKISLGGVDQYLIIRGEDQTKPVMLFLHGGPGSPEFAFMKSTNTAIEKDFVMVYWEQRGAGKSYSDEVADESMNLEQFISDTRELSEILAKRFKKDKIYLLGHSWGSFLGILTAYEYPELFHAYMGVGQVAYKYNGERLSFEWVIEEAKKNKADHAIEALSQLSFPDSLATSETWLDFLMVERQYVMEFGGGVVHEMKGMWPVIKLVLDAKEYTFSEKMKYMPASMYSLEHLWPSVINKNLFNDIDSMQVPVYIFQGAYDYQTPTSIAKEFYMQLKAPKKEFYLFENSAHSPMMEEVDKFNAILREKTQE